MTEGGGGGKNCQNIDYVICERPQLLLSGEKPSFNVLRHQAAELIDQKLANRPNACKLHHLGKPVYVKATAPSWRFQ